MSNEIQKSIGIEETRVVVIVEGLFSKTKTGGLNVVLGNMRMYKSRIATSSEQFNSLTAV
ncbi:predicted protein [Sclerotinia sclerotiorum 1980 UF-70]|uniref:Uncharacterized protein n=1 Tax=Sclerotinia sclerotiorum (strain ATCC 18683 / 1980 / Ss-1) TaxID=665079 RepID=A7F462_SCLS1|nr:predicted protein [Sclerotinia sclerotiorum 1980 UF-70]EDN97533.1 predicted protein [Sclerotinia sclerotiorum 1980 UF-70]